MELRDAMEQIGRIHQHMASARVFRGYRSAATGATAGVAFVAAALQVYLVPDPAQDVGAYLTLWIAAAVVSVSIEAVTVVSRYVRCDSILERETTLCAVQQLIPSLVAGLLITCVLFRFAPEALWMLPGLWAVCFSLGIYASRTLLPPATRWVGGYYMLSGLLALAVFQHELAFSPWAMAGTFGVGQLLSAVVLYWTLERRARAEE
jgi:hypothetical protein